MVKAPALEPELLLDALKDGAFYSSQGPEIHTIAVQGAEMVVHCSPAARVGAVGDGPASSVVHGQNLTEATLPLEGLGEAGYIRVTVADAQGRRAWSNPIWR